MQIHKIKLNMNYESAVLSGEKNFEVRYNDRGYQKGDKVVFDVVDKSGNKIPSPLDGDPFEITYLIHGYGLEHGWCAFGIKEVDREYRHE